MAQKKRAILVDGSGYIFRAYHSLPPMNRPDGTAVNAVFGFTKMLWRFVEDHNADLLAVIFDAGRFTFRNDIYPDYKAHRLEPPEDLRPQFSIIREAVRAFDLPCIEMPGFEADDLIATYARHAVEQDYEVLIVSSDKDLMQLIEPGVTMLDPMKSKRIGPDECFEKFGVLPDRVVDVQSLAGDSTDNVPGVPGIGIKIAAQLITEYGDLDQLLANAENIKQNKRRENLIEFADQARISRDLVRLRRDVEVETPLEELIFNDHTPENLRPFLEENGFKSLLAKLNEGSLGADDEPEDEDAPPPMGSGYELVDDEAKLDAWIARAYAARVIAVDTETNSLDAMRAELVGISMATAPGQACYIPLRHKGSDDLMGPSAPQQVSVEAAIAKLKHLLEDPRILKIGHNIKYDSLIFQHEGIEIAPIDDTMLMSYVLDAGKGGGHGMDDLAVKMFEHNTIKFKDICGTGKSAITFDYAPLDKAVDYAAEDADITLRMWRRLAPRIAKERATTIYQTIERPLVPVLCAMEREGIKVDRALLQQLSGEFAQGAEVLEQQCYELAGETFNLGSPKQLGHILFEKMGLEGGKKTKTGAYATSADVLEELAAKGHELPSKIVEWRQLTKLKSTYTDALQEQIDPITGRVHTSYAMAIASTGRLSSTDPNLQNIPVRTEEGRKIRAAFIAEPGHKLVSIDYSQIELRIVAHMAGEEALIAAFQNGEDIHAATASQMFDVPLEGMDPMVRRQAKAINFGVIYGISAYGLANNLGIPQSDAKAFINSYFERFPGIKTYMESMKKLGGEQGYVTTLFGRKMALPYIKDKNFARRGFAERQAINAPIQGSAADIIKRAMLRLPAAMREANLTARMLLQVHDELVFEVPDAEVERLISVGRQVMEGACDPVLSLRVPLVADAGVGDNWKEAH